MKTDVGPLEYTFFTELVNRLLFTNNLAILSTPYIDIYAPELKTMVGVPQSKEHHPEGDVWTHTHICTRIVRVLLFEGLITMEDAIPAVLAALFHDIGKPSTIGLLIDQDGTIGGNKISFHGHEHVGEKMVDEIFSRNRFLNFYKEQVKYMTRNHMKMHKLDNLKLSTFAEMYTSKYWHLLLILNFADTRSRFNVFPNLMIHYEIHRTEIGNLVRRKHLLEYIEEQKRKSKKIKHAPILSGKELIRLGFKEGPQIGIIQKDIANFKVKLFAYIYVVYKYKNSRN